MKTVTFGTPDADLVLIQPVDERELAGMERKQTTILSFEWFSKITLFVRFTGPRGKGSHPINNPKIRKLSKKDFVIFIVISSQNNYGGFYKFVFRAA